VAGDSVAITIAKQTKIATNGPDGLFEAGLFARTTAGWMRSDAETPKRVTG